MICTVKLVVNQTQTDDLRKCSLTCAQLTNFFIDEIKRCGVKEENLIC